MRAPLPAVLALLPLLGCADHHAFEQSQLVFARYQDALFAGDRAGLRAVLSRESRQLIPHLPMHRTTGKQRLVVVAHERRDPEILLTVRDPNSGDAERTFVLVREDGQLRVDLVATTAFNHERRFNPNGSVRIDPRRMTPDELARIPSLPARPIR